MERTAAELWLPERKEGEKWLMLICYNCLDLCVLVSNWPEQRVASDHSTIPGLLPPTCHVCSGNLISPAYGHIQYLPPPLPSLSPPPFPFLQPSSRLPVASLTGQLRVQSSQQQMRTEQPKTDSDRLTALNKVSVDLDSVMRHSVCVLW